MHQDIQAVRHRILIVEDDPDVRSALAEAMAEVGAAVDVAGDGLEALEQLRNGARPAVILLDLRLPRLAGDEFLREMRADPRFEHLPVITMTGGAGSPQGDDDIVARLHKPIDVDDLRQIVLSLFEAVA
jgi:CheY-like chemotaxis protein